MTECTSQEGIVAGLIDAMTAILNQLATMDVPGGHVAVVADALDDFRSTLARCPGVIDRAYNMDAAVAKDWLIERRRLLYSRPQPTPEELALRNDLDEVFAVAYADRWLSRDPLERACQVLRWSSTSRAP